MTTKITGDNITDGSVTTDDLNAAAKSSGATDGNAFNIGVLAVSYTHLTLPTMDSV